jgi:serine protease AprX
MRTGASMRATRTAVRGLTATLLTVIALVAVRPTAPAQAVAGGRVGWDDTAPGTPVDNVMTALSDDYLRNTLHLTGKGIGVAMIDTGVAPVAGLTGGNVVNGPDFSFEGQDPEKRYVDLNGHGTHLAAIIAGRPNAGGASSEFPGGIAPDAKLTSVKVGSGNGAVDVSQVMAAVDWVVAHRNDDRANPIKVLELAYGTDGTQRADIDPLTHAVENAWRAGIVVVVAAGNQGGTSVLLDPAYDPFVVAVGASDTNGTATRADDTVSAFSNRGTKTRQVDVVAPGRTVLSLRAPGSRADVNYPSARVGSTLFKGSGTSQAAAVMAGTVALLLQKKPDAQPDEIKFLLRTYGTGLGAGGWLPDLYLASYTIDNWATMPQSWVQTYRNSTGTGTLEGARGTIHVTDGTISLTGENDIFGPFSTAAWGPVSSAHTSWKGGTWMGHDWTGTGWTTSAAGVTSWSGRAWSGRAWSGRAWSSDSWMSLGWQGAGWN